MTSTIVSSDDSPTVSNRYAVASLLTSLNLFAVCILLLSSLASASEPTHRYSFDGNANDIIGSAHGTLLGNAVITNGSLVLNGTNGCVQMPANLFTNSDSLTLEIWFSNTSTSPGLVLWNFSGSPSIVFTLQPKQQPPGIREVGGAYFSQKVGCPLISANAPHHLVWTQDALSATASIYLDGYLLAENDNFTAMPGETSTSYLGGETVWAPLNGFVSEFRVYSNGISHLQVLQSGSAGPDTLLPEGETLTTLYLKSPLTVGLSSSTRPPVFADFTTQQHVDITPLPDILFSSSNTNLVRFSPEGHLQAIGLGTAEIQAQYGELSATSLVTVAAGDHYALAHRYDFDSPPGEGIVFDRLGCAHGAMWGGSTYTGDGQLLLDGKINSYVDLPSGILSGLDEVTLEAWVTSPFTGFYPRIFDFGSQANNIYGWGASYFYLTPSGQDRNGQPTVAAVVSTNRIIESPYLYIPSQLSPGQETHFAVTYSPSQNVSKLYTNGVLATSGPAPTSLSLIVDTNNWLGRSQFTDDDYFKGSYNEFRMYRTALSDSEVAASYAAGPDVIGIDFILRQRIDGENLTLCWGPDASSLVLQTCSTVASDAAWTNVSVTPVFTNGQYEAIVALSEGPQFFRLGPP